jgi:hypothetical protein
MDETYLLVLAVAIIVALAAVGTIRAQRHPRSSATDPDATLAVSTEGMKVCPRCGMGNLWTDRSCMSCRTALRG